MLALKVAQRYLDQAHESGDPRFAGLALAALRAWPDAARMPADLLLMRATLQQYLHEFDAAVADLRLLLARPGSERNSQAWLTLATVLRVQGRYADSDAACREVGGAGGQHLRDRVPGGKRGAARRGRRGAQELRGDARRPAAACRARVPG